MQHALKSFVIDYFQLHNVPPDKQDQITALLEDVSSETTLNFILDSLSDVDQVTFLQYFDRNEDEQAIAFAKSKIPDFDLKLAEQLEGILKDLEI